MAAASCTPGVSVSKLAQHHKVNANMLFRWRREYQDGLLGAVTNEEANLIPVTVAADSKPTVPENIPAMESTAVAGRLRIESPRGTLVIEGQPDFLALRLVLESLFE